MSISSTVGGVRLGTPIPPVSFLPSYIYSDDQYDPSARNAGSSQLASSSAVTLDVLEEAEVAEEENLLASTGRRGNTGLDDTVRRMDRQDGSRSVG